MFSLKEFSFNRVHFVSILMVLEKVFFHSLEHSFMFLQNERADSNHEKRGECIVVFVVGSLR